MRTRILLAISISALLGVVAISPAQAMEPFAHPVTVIAPGMCEGLTANGCTETQSKAAMACCTGGQTPYERLKQRTQARM
jgi:hypothetical protein